MAQPLITPRLEVRPVTEEDVDAVFALHSDPVTLADLPWRIMKTRQEAEDRIAWELANERDTGFGMYLIYERASTALVGVCGAMRHGDGLEIGWITLKAFQGRGYATEAASALAHEVQAARWPLFATIRPFNTVSQRVAEKLGFVVTETVTDEYGELLVYRRADAQGEP